MIRFWIYFEDIANRILLIDLLKSHEKKREIKNKAQAFCLSNWMVLPFSEMGKISEGAVWYPSGNIE